MTCGEALCCSAPTTTINNRYAVMHYHSTIDQAQANAFPGNTKISKANRITERPAGLSRFVCLHSCNATQLDAHVRAHLHAWQ